ncbi:hypothetical protein [Azospirillum himalayense]|uniref:PAS domain-containing protein n=1 Tax=Azospirillum himalayense TaxID=654847 RepID=A0ABW0GBH6_9PROT
MSSESLSFKKGARPVIPGSVPASAGLRVDIESVVRAAASQLTASDRHQLIGSQSDDVADRTEAGRKLDKLVTEELRKVGQNNDWLIFVNRPMKSYGVISEDILGQTIEDFVYNNMRYYAEEASNLYNNKKTGKRRLVGNLRPDLAIIDSTRLCTIWDLTSSFHCEHFIKTTLYAVVLSRGMYRCRIGETYWADMNFT